jgi:ribosome modulation factor
MVKASTVVDAFREGQQARRDGKPENANPHDVERLREAWGAGWRTENRFIALNTK